MHSATLTTEYLKELLCAGSWSLFDSISLLFRFLLAGISSPFAVAVALEYASRTAFTMPDLPHASGPCTIMFEEDGKDG
jgi:hypothetical protein